MASLEHWDGPLGVQGAGLGGTVVHLLMVLFYVALLVELPWSSWLATVCGTRGTSGLIQQPGVVTQAQDDLKVDLTQQGSSDVLVHHERSGIARARQCT